MENVRQRIREFIEIQDIKPGEFLEDVGEKRGLLDKSLMNSAVSETIISKILVKYKYINPDWLISGIGGMIRPGYEAIAQKHKLLHRKYRRKGHSYQYESEQPVAMEPNEGYGNLTIRNLNKLIAMQDIKIAELKGQLKECEIEKKALQAHKPVSYKKP